MPFMIVRNDITKMKVDAIVNPTDTKFSAGGGLDYAIHQAAGEELKEACRALKECKVGEARMTPGYRLPCRYIIHTAGPIWAQGMMEEGGKLAECYRNSLTLAANCKCESVAVPLISSGKMGYPKDLVVQIAFHEITDFLVNHEMTIYLVVFTRSDVVISGNFFADIRSYIDDAYAQSHYPERRTQSSALRSVPAKAAKEDMDACAEAAVMSIEEWNKILKEQDEGFSRTLIRMIDERGMKDSECYKLANVDRRLFNKIKNNPDYKPGKSTVLAFAIALKLDLKDTEKLLETAGFALSGSNQQDLVVRFCIKKKFYDIHQINEALFSLDLPLLGY